jgi:hypothetical protein
MRTSIRRLLSIDLAAFALALQGSATADDPSVWQRTDESDGITVYRREVPGSPVIAFRGDGDIDAPIARVASILIDIERGPEWMDSLVDAHAVRRVSETEYVEYDHIGTPFVMVDRDLVYTAKLELLPESKQLVLRFHSVDDPLAPKTRYIRAQLMESSFVLTPLDHCARTHIVADIHTDPMGSVAKWIVNWFQKSWPHNTIVSLRRQAQKADIVDNARLKQALVDAGYCR